MTPPRIQPLVQRDENHAGSHPIESPHLPSPPRLNTVPTLKTEEHHPSQFLPRSLPTERKYTPPSLGHERVVSTLVQMLSSTPPKNLSTRFQLPQGTPSTPHHAAPLLPKIKIQVPHPENPGKHSVQSRTSKVPSHPGIEVPRPMANVRGLAQLKRLTIKMIQTHSQPSSLKGLMISLPHSS